MVNKHRKAVSLFGLLFRYCITTKKKKLLNKCHLNVSISNKKKKLCQLRNLAMNIYHTILNSGDNNFSYCSAWWEFLLWCYPAFIASWSILLIVTIVEIGILVLDVSLCLSSIVVFFFWCIICIYTHTHIYIYIYIYFFFFINSLYILEQQCSVVSHSS